MFYLGIYIKEEIFTVSSRTKIEAVTIYVTLFPNIPLTTCYSLFKTILFLAYWFDSYSILGIDWKGFDIRKILRFTLQKYMWINIPRGLRGFPKKLYAISNDNLALRRHRNSNEIAWTERTSFKNKQRRHLLQSLIIWRFRKLVLRRRHSTKTLPFFSRSQNQEIVLGELKVCEVE